MGCHIEPSQPDACPAVRYGTVRTWGRIASSAIRSPAVWFPALVLLGLTLVFRFSDADMTLIRPFSADVGQGGGLYGRWPLLGVNPWQILYDWGVYPAWILGGGGLAAYIASFFWTKLERWRDPGLFYVLLLLIGPGLIINGVLKPYWGRPRPNAIIPFGGNREFLPVWAWGFGQDEASFPSGHASMGFYLMAPAFVYYRRRPRLAWAFLLVGLVSGGVIGLARIVVGGHFPSDVVWAGGFVYFTALALAAPFRFGQPSRRLAQESLQ
jgi:lipid A 4'-phosphatase